MKNLILLFATLITLSCCSSDDDNSDKLPPETQTGANTAGCLVNGKVFLPKQEGLNPALICNYEFIDGDFFFNLVIRDNSGQGVKSVSVKTSRINLQTNTTYNLDKENTIFEDFTGGSGIYLIDASNFFYTNTIKTGELKITKLDLQNSIISGTFWFDAINNTGETVEIRQGRFDMNY
jgi:hypothetical protein